MNDFRPITSKQAAYLVRLIAQAGKERYQQAKERLGFAELTLLRLSSRQASRLIDELRGQRK
jgi:ABC-type antimicrobial peptide transport system ATPase subunit